MERFLLFRRRSTYCLLLQVAALLFSSGASAYSYAGGPGIEMLRSPQGKHEYCSLVANKANFLNLLTMQESRLAFQNPGGFFNIGVCWWHSRLQRSSLYLSMYQPQAAKPNEAGVFRILDAVYNQRGVVNIPGYQNFYEFTRENYNLIEKYLSTSQILDSIQGEWVAGVMGHSQVSAQEMQQLMTELFRSMNSGSDVIYEMLQMPGLVAHAWLVYAVRQTKLGYDIFYVDSNYPAQNLVYHYQNGNTFLTYPDGTRFVPYIREQGKMTRVWQLARGFCQRTM